MRRRIVVALVPGILPAVQSFKALDLLPSLLASLAAQGLKTPTDIQARTVPTLLEGGSVVGISETGSGKTLAYVLPMLHRLKTLENDGAPVTLPAHPRGLVLVPGRELGEQVSRVFKGHTHGTRLRVRTVLGGTRKQIARQSVNAAFEILVATPGRLTQLLNGKELHLNDVRTVVFDEADQMVDGGFLPVAQRILRACPQDAQIAMYSATLPQSLDVVVRDLFTKPPLKVRTKGSQQVVPTLRTENRMVDKGNRWAVLRAIIDEDSTVGTLLFANTRDQCDKIAQWLKEERVTHATYRGQMDRRERRVNLERFRNGEVSFLLATDLGGRGLDIERVERVVNIHLPQDIDNYLHRVGRTARAGRDGLVINLVTRRDQPLLAKLAKRESKRG
jgi:ATP-dependent RNA helicase RhlE